MGLINLGLTAGAVYAAKKVSDRFKLDNPEGTQGTMETLGAVRQAVSEVASDFKQAVDDSGVNEKIVSTAGKAFNAAKKYAPGAVAKVRDAAFSLSDKAREFADSLSDGVIDAEFTDSE